MRKMLLIDLLSIRKSLVQSVAICVVCAIFMVVSMHTPLVGAAAIAAMLPYMYLTSVYAYDEAGGWQCCRLAMPVSRRDVVLGRYAGVLLVTVGTVALAAVLGMALGAAIDLADGSTGVVQASATEFAGGHVPSTEASATGATSQGVAADSLAGAAVPAQQLGDASVMVQTLQAGPATMAGAVAICALFGGLGVLVIASFVMPLFTRFGTGKGMRLVMLVFVLAFCALFGAVGSLADGDFTALLGSLPIDRVGPGAMVAVAVVVALALYAVSAAVSVRLYATKEL